MELFQKICVNDSSAEFLNDYGTSKNMVARDEAFFLVWLLSHLSQLFMKHGQNICSYNMWAEIKHVSCLLKNMAPIKGLGIFLYSI